MMTFQAAVNRAFRLRDETHRTWYVLGNGHGEYYTVDTLPTLPAGLPEGHQDAGVPVRPAFTAEAEEGPVHD